jgi:hypothetical protein
MSDAATGEFVKSTKWPPNYPHLLVRMLDYHAGNNLNCYCVQTKENDLATGVTPSGN